MIGGKAHPVMQETLQEGVPPYGEILAKSAATENIRAVFSDTNWLARWQ